MSKCWTQFVFMKLTCASKPRCAFPRSLQARFVYESLRRHRGSLYVVLKHHGTLKINVDYDAA